MMTIAPIASSNGYYENNPEGNYYLNDELQSKFIGKGSEDLGIKDKVVDKDIQDNLMMGILPTGETTKRFESKHRTGYDLTFSAPKSVSVLSLVVGDTRLIDAHKNAVEQTINEIEKLASVRNKVNGSYTITNTNNLIVALHTHDTSRELDPQLHTHALVFNLTKNEAGNWQSLSSDKINKTGFIESVYINQLAFGSIYRQILRNEVEQMGFKTIDTGKGLWEIKGVPTEEFSKRRSQIVNEVGEGATAKERDLATLATRKFKTDVDKVQLHQEWNKTLDNTGFVKEDFYNAVNSNELIINVRDTFTINKNAVTQAIEILSDSKEQLTYQDILNTSLSLSAKNRGVVDEIKNNIDKAIETNLITPLDKEKSTFVSSINLEREKNIVQLNEIIKSKETNFEKNYNGVEDKGINSFINSQNNVAILTGQSNLSTQLRQFEQLNQAAKENNLDPIILVRTEKIKNQYNKKGIDNVVSMNQFKSLEIKQNNLIIVVGAENLPLKDVESLLSTTNDKNSSLALLDTKTRIGVGNGIELLRKNGINEYQFTTTNQQEVNVKIESIADHNLRYKQVVKDYVNEYIKSDGNAIIIGNNIKERQHLTDITRTELKEKGLLGKEDIQINIHKPVYLSGQEKVKIENYKKGMILENWNNKKLSIYKIVSIDANRNLLYLEQNKQQSVINIRDLDQGWTLVEKSTIKISENEKLRASGSLLKGTIKNNQELTITQINNKGFTVADSNGKLHNLSFRDNLKIEYDYVKSQSTTLDNEKTVFVALNNKNINQNTLNQLIKSGDEIRIYSPLDYEQTQKKLDKIKNIKLISERLTNGQYSSIEEAIKGRKDNIYTEVQKAVNIGMGIAQGSNVFFSINKLISETLQVNHSLTLDEIKKEIDSQIIQGNIHLLKSVDGLGQQIAVSNEIYQEERKIQSIIINGLDSEKPLLNEKQIANSKLDHLTDGQKAATNHILTSTDKFIGIQGLAGVGKTTQLKAVLEELKANNSNIEIIGLAPTHKAVYELQSVGVKAQTLSSFLVEAKNEIKDNPNYNLNNKLFLIDESSMIGNKNITSLYEIISTYGGRGIYSGDSKQLLSIDSGAAFSFMQNHTELKFSVMNDIVRQNKNLKPAIYSLLNNRVEKSLSIIDSIGLDQVKRDNNFTQLNNVLDSKLIEKGGYNSIVDYIAKDYSTRDKATRDNTIIVTQLNRDKDIINQSIHNELFQLNKLGNTEYQISTLAPILNNEYELNKLSTYEKNINNIVVLDKNYYQILSVDNKTGVVTLLDNDNKKTITIDPMNIGQYSDISLYKDNMLNISEKDKILINRTNLDKGFVANSEWTISKIENNNIHLTNQSGEKIINLNNKDELHFTLSYARTVHSSQGASSPLNIVYEPIPDMRSYYVGISRAKEHVTFITDNLKDWVKNVGQIEDRLSATDILGNEFNKNNIDSIIRNEISNIDSNVNFEQIKKQLNEFNLVGLQQEEIKAKVDEIIFQEKNSINNLENNNISVELNDKLDKTDKINNIVDRYVDSIRTQEIVTSEQNTKNLVIDEKTL